MQPHNAQSPDLQHGMCASLAVLWVAMAFVAYPLCTAKEIAAWSRDRIIIGQPDAIAPLEQRALDALVDINLQVARRHGLQPRTILVSTAREARRNRP